MLDTRKKEDEEKKNTAVVQTDTGKANIRVDKSKADSDASDFHNAKKPKNGGFPTSEEERKAIDEEDSKGPFQSSTLNKNYNKWKRSNEYYRDRGEWDMIQPGQYIDQVKKLIEANDRDRTKEISSALFDADKERRAFEEKAYDAATAGGQDLLNAMRRAELLSHRRKKYIEEGGTPVSVNHDNPISNGAVGGSNPWMHDGTTWEQSPSGTYHTVNNYQEFGDPWSPAINGAAEQIPQAMQNLSEWITPFVNGEVPSSEWLAQWGDQDFRNEIPTVEQNAEPPAPISAEEEKLRRLFENYLNR